MSTSSSWSDAEGLTQHAYDQQIRDTALNWDRFDFYGQFVESLQVLENVDMRHSNLLKRMEPERSHSTKQILPNLRSLDAECIVDHFPSSTFSLFWVPTIQDLRTEFRAPDKLDVQKPKRTLCLVSTFLQVLTGGACRHLKKLNLDMRPFLALGLYERYEDQLAEALLACPKLEVVDITLYRTSFAGSSSIFKALGSLSELSSLSFLARDIANRTWDGIQGPTFTLLKSVRLNCHLATIHTLNLPLQTSPSLQSLDLTLCMQSEWESMEMETVTGSLARFAPNLVELSLNIPCAYPTHDNGPPTHSWTAFVGSFLALRQLQVFSLKTSSVLLDFDNSRLWQMASAWPQLRMLCVDPRMPEVSDSDRNVTLDGLNSLACHCPQLTRLSIGAVVAHPAALIPHDSVRAVRLTVLDLQNVEAPDEVAAVIDQLWPNAELVEPDCWVHEAVLEHNHSAKLAWERIKHVREGLLREKGHSFREEDERSKDWIRFP